MLHVTLPIALFHQSFSLFFARVLLSFIGLVEDLLGCWSPFETVASELLEGWLAAGVVRLLPQTLHRLTELWEEKEHLILTAFVCHIIDRPLWCLVEF